ncbi:hypothetical protein OH76DRAFT_748573 [Lentinus brumalis]|uniref:Uncharacterized protein n=1 Tax=Lentinus brumalis TaxID=2498619 RepID=A0A371DSL4_9APHY|nr:hypothetical protein OH76DRAFT_748573 [Polyporus brumalis]
MAASASASGTGRTSSASGYVYAESRDIQSLPDMALVCRHWHTQDARCHGRSASGWVWRSPRDTLPYSVDISPGPQSAVAAGRRRADTKQTPACVRDRKAATIQCSGLAQESGYTIQRLAIVVASAHGDQRKGGEPRGSQSTRSSSEESTSRRSVVAGASHVECLLKRL